MGESLLDERFVDDLVATMEAANPAASEVLQPGARVCFTGTARSASGRMCERDEMERLARDAGLIPAANVTKTKGDQFVVVEVGTQTGKAREYDTSVISADGFFAWFGAY